MQHMLERTKFVQQSINSQATVGRMKIPLDKDEVAIVKGVNWTFWPHGGDGTATEATFWGALAHDFNLEDLETAVSGLTVGREGHYWAHFFIHNKMGSNIGFSQQQMTHDLIIPEPGYPIGGDQGVATFQDSGINPTDFIVTIWYVRANIGVAGKVAVARRTSFSRSKGS